MQLPWQADADDEVDIISPVLAGRGHIFPVFETVHDPNARLAAEAVVDLAVIDDVEYDAPQQARNSSMRPKKSIRLFKATPYVEARAPLVASWVTILLLEPKASDADRRMVSAPKESHSEVAPCYI